MSKVNALLQRFHTTDDDTLGLLFLERQFMGFVPEDQKQQVKVKGETRIPAGRYQLVLENSPKYGPKTITVSKVPDFSFIRVHVMNTDDDTEGCIGPGYDCHFNPKGQSSTGRSIAAVKGFYDSVLPLIEQGDEVWLTVRDEEALNFPADAQSFGSPVSIA